MTRTTTYDVQGMTCAHCVGSVTGEISRIEGVQDVQVDLAGGTVTVTSEAELERATVRSAVEDAGYELG
ncbi:MAG: Heavy metal transport/detoxification protein [Acidimicrobiales bacterium]|nr:Heavy metal transport/detoxification protein [Acidimicrobiales bacterium]